MPTDHAPAHDTVTADPADSFLVEDEAARFIKVKPRKLQYWRQNGGGPAYFKFGQAVRYRLPDLLAWAETHRRRSTSEATP